MSFPFLAPGTTRPSKALTLLMLCGLILFAGCSDPLPELFPISGTVTIGGKPVPHVAVKFIPMAEGLGANTIAKGTTDGKGRFTLEQMSGELGCRACMCKVTLAEGPIPDELRAMGQDAAPKIKAFRASLSGRPLPKEYQTIRTTPLEFEITGPNEEFEINVD